MKINGFSSHLFCFTNIINSLLKYYHLIVVIIFFYSFSYSSAQELKGIPQVFDAEYTKIDDYLYMGLDDILSYYYTDKQDRLISTIGYISRDSSWGLIDNELLIQRYFVTCCITHAKPVSIYIIFENADKDNFQDGEWVKINGKVTQIKKKWGISPAILVERIIKIPKPENPYLNCFACPSEH